MNGSLSAQHIAEVRAITRLELLRSVMLSHASEVLDVQTPTFTLTIDLDQDEFWCRFELLDGAGVVVKAGTL
jgi:hypothetical protein